LSSRPAQPVVDRLGQSAALRHFGMYPGEAASVDPVQRGEKPAGGFGFRT
jgi:hypothetical protein